MSDNTLKSFFETSPLGFVLLEIITPIGNGAPYLRFLDGNPVFRKYAVLEGADFTGATLEQLFPKLTGSDADWRKLFQRVLTSNGNVEFAEYITPLRKWLHVHAYPVNGTQIAVVSTDLSAGLQLQMNEVQHQEQDTLRNGSEQESVNFPRDHATGSLTTKKPVEQNTVLNQFGMFACKLAYLPYNEIFPFIVSSVKQLFGVQAAYITTYVPTTSELVVQYSSLSDEENRKIIRLLGGELLQRRIFLSESNYAKMVREGYSRISSINELTFGAIPEFIGKAIETVLDVDWIAALALMHREKLAGTLYLMGNKKQPYPEKEEVLAFAAIVANAINRKDAEEALIRNEELYRLVLELAPDAFLRGDSHGNLIGANNKAVELFGYSKDELFTMNIKQLFPPSVLEEKPLRYDLLNNGVIFTTERMIQTKAGESVCVEMNSRVMPDGTYQSFVRDISERKKAEDALLESESKLSALFAAMTEMVVTHELVFDQNGKAVNYRIIDCNPSFTRITGISREDAIGKLASDVYGTPEPPYLAEFLGVVMSGNPYHYETFFPPMNKYFSISVVSPAANRFATITTDVSEIKRVVEELRHSRNMLDYILNTIPQSVFWKDTESRYIGCNRRFVQTVGLESSESIIGKTDFDLPWPKEEAEAYRADDRVVIENKQPKSHIIEPLQQIDGSRLWIDTTKIPLLDEAGNVYGVLGVYEDITERKQAEDALAQERILYKDLIASQPSGVYRLRITAQKNWGVADWVEKVGSNYKLELVSDLFCQILGATREQCEANASIVVDSIHPDDRPDFVATNVRALETLEAFKWEGRLKLKDKITWVYFASVPRYLDNGDVIWTGNLMDISDRKLAEGALQESEARFQSIITVSNTGAWEYQKDKGLLWCSPEYFSMLGLNHEEFSKEGSVNLFNNWIALLHPEDRESAVTHFEEYLKSGSTAMYESYFRMRHSDGHWVWIWSRGKTLLDSEGQPTNRTVGTHIDISDRKRAEEELIKAITIAEESERKYSSIVNILPDGVIIHVNGRIVFANKAVSDILNIPDLQQIIGKPAIEFVHPDYRKTALERIQRSMKENTVAGYIEEVFINGNGGRANVLVCGMPFKYEGQDAMLTVFTDITLLKDTEQSLIAAKEKAEESDRLKSAFLANMSHEIRTPMNGILGFLELLQEPDLSNESRDQFISIVNKSGKRLLDTINDIIEISKIEAGQLPVKLSEININDLLAFHYKFFKKEAEDKGLVFSVNNLIANEITTIISDRHKLDGILTNLIKNAIKFTTSGRIELSVALESNTLRFTVKDTGVGIQPERIQAIFERFVQADLLAYNRPYEGSGLGLPIVKAYLELLNGNIWVNSVPGEGSEFCFTLPRVLQLNEEPSINTPIVSGYRGFSNLSVLVAEDDDTSFNLTRIFLEKLGVTPGRARNGSEVISLLEQTSFDLIFMDIKMPVMNGFETTRMIRTSGNSIYIVALTAFALLGDRERALEAGCNDYISKPVSFQGITDALQRFVTGNRFSTDQKP